MLDGGVFCKICSISIVDNVFQTLFKTCNFSRFVLKEVHTVLVPEILSVNVDAKK